MKILGACEPDYVWYDYELFDPKLTKWYGFGLWSVLNILKLAKSNDTLEILTETSNILETVSAAEVKKL